MDGSRDTCAHNAKCAFFNHADQSHSITMLRHLICLRAHTKCEIRQAIDEGKPVPPDAHPNKALGAWLK